MLRRGRLCRPPDHRDDWETAPWDRLTFDLVSAVTSGKGRGAARAMRAGFSRIPCPATGQRLIGSVARRRVLAGVSAAYQSPGGSWPGGDSTHPLCRRVVATFRKRGCNVFSRKPSRLGDGRAMGGAANEARNVVWVPDVNDLVARFWARSCSTRQ